MTTYCPLRLLLLVLPVIAISLLFVCSRQASFSRQLLASRCTVQVGNSIQPYTACLSLQPGVLNFLYNFTASGLRTLRCLQEQLVQSTDLPLAPLSNGLPSLQSQKMLLGWCTAALSFLKQKIVC